MGVVVVGGIWEVLRLVLRCVMLVMVTCDVGPANHSLASSLLVGWTGFSLSKQVGGELDELVLIDAVVVGVVLLIVVVVVGVVVVGR